MDFLLNLKTDSMDLIEELPRFFEFDTNSFDSFGSSSTAPMDTQPAHLEELVTPQTPQQNFSLFPNHPASQIPPNYTLSLIGLPEKSRVETQMKMVLKLADVAGHNVNKYDELEIDEFLIAEQRRKPSKKTKDKKSENGSILTLKASVVDSSKQKEIKRCIGCTQRERKALERRNKNQKGTVPVKMETGSCLEEEKNKTLQFYCDPKINFSSGEAIIPIRITCYCRHHQEKAGFSICISLYDGNVLIASQYSPLVMITDDHKMTVHSKQNEALPTEVKTINPKKRARLDSDDEPIAYPTIEKVIPNTGPTTGGIEITVLGKYFHEGLSCVFGSNESQFTQTWGPTTMVTRLPPAFVAGPVYVTLFDKTQRIPQQTEQIVFTYVNSADRQLMELALQVIGMKLTGRIEDPASVALQIVSENQQQQGYNNYMVPGQSNFANFESKEELIGYVIRSLEFISQQDNQNQVEFSHQDESGHQMLHYAVILESSALLDCLLSFSHEETFDLNLQDSNGWTALHFAAFLSNSNFVKQLIEAGSNALIKNEKNHMAFQLSKDPEIIRYLQEQVRIQSGQTNRHIPPVLPEAIHEEPEESVLGDEIISMDLDDAPKNNNLHLGSYDLAPVMGLLNPQTAKEIREAQSDGSTLMAIGMNFIKSLLYEFWDNYRVLIYLGLLAATGTWTFVDYLPRFSFKSPTVLITKAPNPLNSFCNPPTPDCADPNLLNPTTRPPVSMGLTVRSYEIKGYSSAIAYFLNFGQFFLFMLSLFIIILHFKDRLGPVRFGLLFLFIALLALTGTLFIFDVFGL